MAASLYRNQLDRILSSPGSFEGTPGFQFALNSGNDAIARKYAAMGMGASGNVMGEMGKFSTGLAMQDYGNQVDRLGRLAAESDQDLLGNKTADQNYALGNKTADQTFALGMTRADNDFTLGTQQNNNTATNNWLNYALGRDQNNITSARDANNFTLGQGQNQIGAFNAQTNRGSAQATAWNNDQANQRAWYSVFPRQRYA